MRVLCSGIRDPRGHRRGTVMRASSEGGWSNWTYWLSSDLFGQRAASHHGRLRASHLRLHCPHRVKLNLHIFCDVSLEFSLIYAFTLAFYYLFIIYLLLLFWIYYIIPYFKSCDVILVRVVSCPPPPPHLPSSRLARRLWIWCRTFHLCRYLWKNKPRLLRKYP